MSSGARIDHFGHIYGFLSGALLSYLIGPRLFRVGSRTYDKPILNVNTITNYFQKPFLNRFANLNDKRNDILDSTDYRDNTNHYYYGKEDESDEHRFRAKRKGLW